MKNLSMLASQENMLSAIENSKKVSKSVKRADKLSNKTVFNSVIYSKSKKEVSETSKIDFALCLLSSVTDTFQQSQVLELLALVDCKRTTVAKHVFDKQNVYADFLTADKTSKIFTVHNREFFQQVVSMSEFKQQLEKFAYKLFEFADFQSVDYEQAHFENVDYEQAYIMNAEFDKKKVKKVTRKKRVAAK